MRRNDKFEIMYKETFSLADIICAYYSCRRNKRTQTSSLEFEIRQEENLLQLYEEIATKSYKPGCSNCFVVTTPKLREVFGSNYRDRIVHHLLVGKLEPIFDKSFLETSFACRKGKGLLKGVLSVRKMLRQSTKSAKSPSYYGQFDVQSFFMSVDKDVLYSILERKIRRKFPKEEVADILWLARVVIFHDPTTSYNVKGDSNLLKLIPSHKSLFSMLDKKGLPIGNLTSQFFANVYLNELDQYIKRELKVKYYARYADDFLIIDRDKQKIKLLRKQIDLFLNDKLKLQLNPEKDKYGSVYSGIDFIGYIIKPRYTLVRNRVVRSLKQKLIQINRNPSRLPNLIVL